MKVEMQGVHRVNMRLAGGQAVIYHYAWRGGPRMVCAPGTPAFMAEYLRLTRHKPRQASTGTVLALIEAYKNSSWFTSRKATTRKEYERYLSVIAAKFGDMQTVALEAKGARRLILNWLDTMTATPRSADLTKAVFSRVIAYAMDQEEIVRHPLLNVERKSAGSRRDNIWPVETIKHLIANGKPHLVKAAVLALMTMQRQGDCLFMLPMAYDGERVRIKQMKTGAAVWIRPSADVVAILEEAKANNWSRVLMTSQGNPWTSSGFRASWGDEMRRLGITGLTFHDLRGSAITYARAAGLSIAEIAEVSGHSEKEAETIIRRFYLAGDNVVRALQKAMV